jgi:hypothetical protein
VGREVIVNIAAASPAAPLDDLLNWAIDKIAPPLVAGLAIAVVGSLLLPRLNEVFKGRREHLNNAVQSLLDEVSGLQAAASAYWSVRGRDGPAEAQIEFQLGKISSLLSAISEDLWPGRPDRPADLFATLASEVVTSQFGVDRRKAEVDRGRTIAAVAGLLASDVLVRRRRYFHRSGYWRTVIRLFWRCWRGAKAAMTPFTAAKGRERPRTWG